MLERLFKIQALQSTVRRELIAGLTTFLTMAYIVIVNPDLLSIAGMDHGAVFVATCLAAAIACFIMGCYANLPIALAPGMGLNAFFTFTIVKSMGYSWEIALGCVFLSGLVFVLISLFKLREWLINSIPTPLKKSIGAGIGAFIAFIALQKAGIISDHPAVLVTLGNLNSVPVLMTFLGLFLTIALVHLRVPGAALIGIMVITVLGLLFDPAVQYDTLVGMPPSIAPTLGQMDLLGALEPAVLTVVFSLFFVDLFDTAGTLIAVSERAGLSENGQVPRLKQALLADSSATLLGAFLGTSNVTSYVESASGVAAGGRTGLTAVTVGVFFLAALFFHPLVKMIPAYATNGALLYVAVLMLYSIGDIDWADLTESAPVAITFLMIPLSYSIADGITLGFISYVILKILTGKIREVHWGVMLLSALLLFKLLFLH